MNITYTQNGDYLIPNIIIRKTKPLGHYGRLRKAYLEMHRPILFNELVLSDKLFEHCAEIDETARNRMELIVRSLAEQNGVTEQLKAENQMEWVRQMNACKAQAEEVVKVRDKLTRCVGGKLEFYDFLFFKKSIVLFTINTIHIKPTIPQTIESFKSANPPVYCIA